MQYNTKEYSTIQHNTRQTIRYATLLYNTTHTDKHAVHYVNFVSCPYLRLPALHCIKLHSTTLHCTTVYFTALQSIALHYAALQRCNSKGTNRNAHIQVHTQKYGCIHKYTDSSIDAYAHMYGKHPYTHTRQRYRDSQTHKCTTCYDVTLHFIYVDHVRIVHTSVHACFRCVHRPIHGKAFHNVHTQRHSQIHRDIHRYIETYIEIYIETYIETYKETYIETYIVTQRHTQLYTYKDTYKDASHFVVRHYILCYVTPHDTAMLDFTLYTLIHASKHTHIYVALHA